MTNYKGEKMNKSELIDALAHETETTKASAGKFIDALTQIITNNLKNGEQIAIPGFGNFSVVPRAARTGRNPQTGETIQIKAAKIPKFKAGKNLKDAVA